MVAATTGREGLAARYATALFQLADDEKKLDKIADDLRGLSAMIDGSNDLRRLIRSPVISREESGQAMAAVVAKAGCDTLTANFVGLVARNRRLFALPGMIAAYLEELARRRGEMTAEVTVAAPLDSKQSDALVDALKKSLGAKVSVETKIDPSILGGMIVRVGSRMIDSSISGRLQRLRLAMKGTA